jgi:energy-coupling factor transport system substrate-specific component
MSWQLAAYTILAVALLLGFAWYERTHPSARTLALVATLAALAALGRIAFAPLPNVKPTTDIVLISGFALGGAPGFAVGAIAAVASNLFFGQGPWTPWQMAGWGGVGVGGALLARVSRGRAGRVRLACAGAFAGLAFGALMNLSTWVTFTGEHTAAQYAAISGAALPFDIAHAVGNAVFAVAFGPALVRALVRFRERVTVRWVSPSAFAAPAIALVVAAGAFVAMAASPSAAQAATPTARAVAYLKRAQNTDGGFGPMPKSSSTQLHTGWSALGLAAARLNPREVTGTGASPIDYIRGGIATLEDVGELERTILVLTASGLDPRSFAGSDLMARLESRQKADGSVGGLVNLSAFALLAYRGAGLPVGDARVRRAARFVARQQNADGGFSYAKKGFPSGIDDTSAAAQALVAARASGWDPRAKRHAALDKTVRFLRRVQDKGGGFPLQPDGIPNAQSTAWAVQALVAARRNPDKVFRRAGRTPLRFLRSLVAANGAVRYSRESTQTPVWVTAQAIVALERKAFPLAAVPLKAPTSARPATARKRPSTHHRARRRPSHRARPAPRAAVAVSPLEDPITVALGAGVVARVLFTALLRATR